MGVRSIPAALDRAARHWPDGMAIEDGEVRLTWLQLREQAHQAARALVRRGIEPGDRVAIWAPNTWEWVVVGLGIHCAGAAIVTLNTRYKGHEARYILDRSGSKMLFTVDGFLGLDFARMLERPELPTVCFRTSAFGDFMAEGLEDARLPEVPPEAIADILFTSGTTGAPKGAMCTQEQAVRAYTSWSEVVGLRAEDRYLIIAPFFHAFGYKAGWLSCVLTGATMLPQATFDLDAVLQRIARDRVSMLPGPPAIYQTFLLREDLQQHDLSSLRLAVTGASAIPVKLIEDMREVLGFDTVITGYGLTEACGIATMCRFDDDPQTIATTSGRAIDGVEVRCVDADGTEVARGEPGHVLVRGYNIMKGYFGDPERTAETVVDGWLHTGDIGVMDERGYLRITDRLKDMFIVGGFNAYPAEIEHMVLEHPSVAEVAVIGVPDARLGEVAMAFVVPKGDLDELQLIEWCRERMANFKVPRSVRLVEALPRNASTKVMKFELRKLLDA